MKDYWMAGHAGIRVPIGWRGIAAVGRPILMAVCCVAFLTIGEGCASATGRLRASDMQVSVDKTRMTGVAASRTRATDPAIAFGDDFTGEWESLYKGFPQARRNEGLILDGLTELDMFLLGRIIWIRDMSGYPGDERPAKLADWWSPGWKEMQVAARAHRLPEYLHLLTSRAIESSTSPTGTVEGGEWVPTLFELAVSYCQIEDLGLPILRVERISEGGPFYEAFYALFWERAGEAEWKAFDLQFRSLKGMDLQKSIILLAMVPRRYVSPALALLRDREDKMEAEGSPLCDQADAMLRFREREIKAGVSCLDLRDDE